MSMMLSTGARRFMLLCLSCCVLPADAAVHEVILSNNAFTPDQLEIQPGDTVLWKNRSGGGHNVMSNTFISGEPSADDWEYQRTYQTPGEYEFWCQPHFRFMRGKVTVLGDAPPPAPPFIVNEGVSGAWYEPATSGQGFFFDVEAARALFTGAWFTWTGTIGERDWYTFLAAGFAGNPVVATVFRNSGGRFDDPDVQLPPAEEIGTVEIEFADCGNASLHYTLEDSDPPRTGTIELVRILAPTAQCLQANPGG